jgi:hypothetical protein
VEQLEPTDDWYRENPERWAAEQRIARAFLSPVDAGNEHGQAYIAGTYRLFSDHGHHYGDFQLRIVYPRRFPLRNRHPNVFLESHHHEWVNERDSHIERSWRLCLFIPRESGIDFSTPDSLVHLLAKVHSFLLLERIYQKRIRVEASGGSKALWPGPQRSHGYDGMLEEIAEHGRPESDEVCICGSGDLFGQCHETALFPDAASISD